MSGARSYHAGLAAEDQVSRHYVAAGFPLAARRWRGRGGEIDLVHRDGSGLIMVEVKRAATHAIASERLGPRQMRRIWSAAAEYLAGEPCGQDTAVRVDVALVDDQGRIAIVENVTLH